MIKKGPVRLNKLLQAAHDQSCVRCGKRDGTVVAAHYQGFGSYRLGKARGMKPHDFCVADLCGVCHRHFDEYEGRNDESRGWEFLMLCMETLARRFRDGVVK